MPLRFRSITVRQDGVLVLRWTPEGASAAGDGVGLPALRGLISGPGAVITGELDPLGRILVDDGEVAHRHFHARVHVAEGSRWWLHAPSGVKFWGDLDDPSLCGMPTGDWWAWDLADAVGQTELRFAGCRMAVVAVPHKLADSTDNPVQRLAVLLDELWNRHLALVRRLGRLTGLTLGAGAAHRSPLQTLFLLQHLLTRGGVGEAWNAVVAEPTAALLVRYPIVDPSRARRPVLDGPRGPYGMAGGLHEDGTLARVRDRRPERTTDIPANRLAIRLAIWMEREATEAAALLRDEMGGKSAWGGAETWRQNASRLAERAREVRAAPTLAMVDPDGALDPSSPSLVLDRRVQPLLRAWSLLADGVGFPPEVERMLLDPLKESYDLFEYWCWFALCDAVEHALTRDRSTAPFLGTTKRLSGERDLAWGLEWSATSGDRTIRVLYNKTAGRGGDPLESYSIRFRPDLVLEESRHGTRRVVVFDAKYRVDVVRGFRDEDEAVDLRRRGKAEDLKVMHGYRDALRAPTKAGGDGSPPRWVLSLYPGDELALYPVGGGGPTVKVDALGAAAGGVGAIPVSPGRVEVLQECVRLLLGVGSGRAAGRPQLAHDETEPTPS